MKEIEIKIKKIHPNAIIPSYAHNGDVGMDMTAVSVEYDVENDMYIYHTGLSFESDFNIGQFLFLKSSNCKTDAYLCNHVGIADSAIYRGEIQFRMKNRESIESIASREAMKQFIFSLNMSTRMDPRSNLQNHIQIASDLYKQVEDDVKERAKNLEYAPYKVGDRIGQMVFLGYPTVKLIEVDELSETDRGEKGFGSSGK